MELSVIIVNWNTKDMLLNCIRSIISQIDPAESEIIVVDNASTDGSCEAVRDAFPHVKVIQNKVNLGFAKANNIGIRQSCGRYVCLVNSDIIAKAECIKKMCAYLDKHYTVGMVGPRILNPDGTLQRTCKHFPTIWNTFCRALALDSLIPKSRIFSNQLMTFWQHDKVKRVDILSGCFLIVKREAILKVGLLEETFFMYAEDKDWCKRFWESGWQVVYLPCAEAIHYGGASSAAAPIKYYIEERWANLQYYKKHYSKHYQLFFWLIMLLHEAVRVMGGAVFFVVKPSKRERVRVRIKTSISCIYRLLFLAHLEVKKN